jgi:sec-independent protein translocase protein TatC
MLLPKVSEYLGLIMTLIFAFGLVFQLPVVTTLLARVGLASSRGSPTSANTPSSRPSSRRPS